MFNRKCAVGVVALLLTIGWIGELQAKPRTVLDLYYSCGRVSVSGAAGSGTIVAEKENSFLVLTNKHVTSNNTVASVDFWPAGNQKRVQGKVIWTRYENGMSVDLALIEIPKEQFQGWTPKVLKIAPYDVQLQTNSYIFSIGSPRAYHSLAWNGRVKEMQGATFTFLPTSISGQSGSSILANVLNKETGEYETRIVGVLTWSVGEQGASLGAAQKHQVLLDAVAGRVSYIQPIPGDWKEVETRVTPLDELPPSWRTIPEPLGEDSPLNFKPTSFLLSNNFNNINSVNIDPLICPYCGGKHEASYTGPCPGGTCPTPGGPSSPSVPNQPSPGDLGPLVPEDPGTSPDYPDLTKPPILDGPPLDDTIGKDALKILQDSVKSVQDALKSIDDRVSKLEGGWLSMSSLVSTFKWVVNNKRTIMWVLLGCGIIVIFFIVRNKNNSSLTTEQYSTIVKNQMNKTAKSERMVF